MARNLERFKKDLDRLVNRGELLKIAMQKELVGGEEFGKWLRQAIKDRKQSENVLKKIPEFREGYELWYSEALAVIRQLLPDRLSNFISLYEKPKGRKSIENENYVIQDYLQHVVVRSVSGETKVNLSAAFPQFQQQLGILKAAEARFESSLFEIRQLERADLFDNELDAARELLKRKFLRAAGAVAGVVLEKHLAQVCEDHKIKVPKKNPTIADLNELLKANCIVDLSQWRHVSMLADIRNLCDHNKQKEPTTQQVTDLIEGADKVLKTIA